jgi:purine-binding chemotaxis protein CheW
VAATPEAPSQPKTSAIEEAIKNNSQIESVTPEEAPAYEEKEHELLAFVVSGEEHGVDIMVIKEIIRPVDITCVPRVPDYVKGIISLRGTVVPVIDMAKRLGLKAQQPGKRSRIIVVTSGTSLVGFSVDSVTEVVRIKESSVEPPPATLTDGMAECVKGVVLFKDRLIIMMDLDKTLNTLDLFLTTR